jgi:phage terminase large subunit
MITIPQSFQDLFKPHRYKVYYGGRGGAKSESICRALLILAAQKKIRILCARELQGSIQESVHKLLSDIINSNDTLRKFYEIQKATIIGKNGSEFLFKGLKHNITEIKSMANIDICFIEEAEKVSDVSWEVLIPTIRKDSSEIWISFNPKNATDPTYERFVKYPPENAFVKKVSWRDNPFFPEVLNDERKALLAKDEDAYNHVWEGEPDTRRNGAVYAKQITQARDEGRITRVPYDPSCEVFTAWDLGFGDATSIWCLQFVGRELRWLEYYENAGEQLQHYVDVVKTKKYNYSSHYLPHDGGHGNIRGESVSIQLSQLGLSNIVLEREQDITAGIELVRQTLQYSVFDAEGCKQGIKALESYHYEWDDNRQAFKKSPLHDWSSNGADAARYAARAASMRKGGLIKKDDPFKTAMNIRGNGWMGA